MGFSYAKGITAQDNMEKMHLSIRHAVKDSAVFWIEKSGVGIEKTHRTQCSTDGLSPKNQCGAGHYKQYLVYNECCNWVLVKHQWSHCNTVNLNFIGFVVVSLYLFSFCSWVRALRTRSLYLNLRNNVLKYFKSPQGSENFFFPLNACLHIFQHWEIQY